MVKQNKILDMKNYSIEISNGVGVFILLGGYFLFLDLVGLADQFYLRIFNVLFVMYGVNRTIQTRLNNGLYSYFGNLVAGFFTSIVGVGLGVVGLAIYIGVFRGESYMVQLADSLFITAQPGNLFQYCLGLMIEGVGSSVVLSYAIMQRWKNVNSVLEAQKSFFE